MPLPRLLALLAVGASTSLAAIDPAQLDAARALFKSGKQPLEAQTAFEAIAAADPQNVEAQIRLGVLALRRDDVEQAVGCLEKAVALAPNDAECHHTLGDAYGRSAQKAGLLSKFGLARKCLAEYERAVALAPANVDYRQSLFEYYRQAPGIAGGGTDKALAQAVEIKKLDLTRGRIAFATLYAGEKQYDKAFAEFEEVLKAAPDDYTALYQTGRLAAITGQRLDQGLACFRRCLELPPAPNLPHAAAHWRIGTIYERKGDTAAARTAYETALKLEPRFTPAADSLKKLR